MHWPYLLIMLAAVATGILVFWRTRQPVELSVWQQLGIGLGAFCGGMIGAKLPFVLADWNGFLSGAAWLDDGKTIVAGLVGGYFGAEAAEWALRVRVKMCDSFAAPVAAGIAVGRLACFSAGCCYGTVTTLPWGVDFGDGQMRHPTQLYESAFHLVAAVVLYQLLRRHMFQGRLIKLYFVSYFLYRFASEFIRPEPALWLGLTGYQWAALVLAVFFALWTCPGCRPIGLRWPRRRRALPSPLAGEGSGVRGRQSTSVFRLWCTRKPSPQPSPKERGGIGIGNGYADLKPTRTVCPECLTPVPGTVFQQDGRVYLRRECAQHGTATALVSSDRRHYYLRDEVPHPPPAACQCGGGGPMHKTCIALLEMTEACNLRCPVCYAGSPSGGHRPLDELCADLEAFLAARGPLDVLQLSGGEPLVHPDLLRMIDHAKRLPVGHVMINTNGLVLAGNDTLGAELARRKPRLELFLQFDGLDRQSHLSLRGADLLERKRAVIDTIVRHDLPTTLVCTLVKGVNEGQVGELVRMGMATPQLRGITFQPATWCGRFRPEIDPLDRLTAADVIGLVVRQSNGLLAPDDFQPLPCSNPNCCMFSFAARRRLGPFVPLARLFRYGDHVERLSDRVNFDMDDARACCGLGWRPEDFFRVVVKPFMDAYTYDQDRIDECCVHVIRPGGKAVSFCQFNTLARGRASERPARASDRNREYDVDRATV